MTERGSVSLWIQQIKAGDSDAAQPLWERYYYRLVGLARKKLGDMPRRASDEEDAVQSAFNSFFDRARDGRFPKLSDRDDLWRLLVVITARKALNQRAHQGRAKRGKGKLQSGGTTDDSERNFTQLEAVIGNEPSPEFAAQVAEQLEIVMERLDDPSLRLVAYWKLEGRTNPEIGRLLDCSISAVERKLRMIRSRVESALEDE